MVSDLGELIARYEAARDRVEKLIESGIDSESELIDADRALSAAFNDLLHSSLGAGEHSIQRLHYLLNLIRENQPGNQLIERLTDRIWQDVLDLDFSSDESTDSIRKGTK